MISASIVADDVSARAGTVLNRLVGAVSRRPLTTAFAVVALITALRLTGTVDSDVSAQLWIAHQINGGARLYRDIIEVNPPLWFWMALPVERVASLLNVRAEQVLVPLMGSLAALSIAATNRLLHPTTPLRHALLLVYAALILLAMPWLQLGQREQLVLIGTIPYAILIAARRSGRPVPAILAVLVAVGAALGFALKHYFLIVPVLLELWLLTGLRGRWRPIRPETAAILAVGIGYGLAVTLWARDFLDSIVPLARLAYGVTGAMRPVDLFQPAVVFSLIALGLIGAHWRSLVQKMPADAAALLVAAVGFLLVYFIQAKGWAYHALPLLGCSSLGFAALLAGAAKPPRLVALAAPALLLMPLAIEVQAAIRDRGQGADIRHAVAGLRPGETVGFVATDWSIAYKQDLQYPSRYMGFWMLSAVVRNEALGGPNPRLTELGDRIVHDTLLDYRCMPPRRIIFPRPAPGSGDFDVLPFFLRNAEFGALMAHYRLVERTTISVYEIASPLPPAASGPCIVRPR